LAFFYLFSGTHFKSSITNDIDWLFGKVEWLNLVSIGAINRRATYKEVTTDEWHYYITSRDLTAEELLHHFK